MSVPMIVERQGDSECILAAIAAIAKWPLADVRALACKHAKVRKWKNANGWTFWNAVASTAQDIGGPALAALVKPGNDVIVGASHEPVPVLPAVGRGIVSFRTSLRPGERKERPGHICVWQDGMLYDSAGDPARPWTLPAYLLANPELRLKRIRTLPIRDDSHATTTPDLGY